MSYVSALAAGGDKLGISAVNLAEFHAGALRGTFPMVDRLLDALIFWGTTRPIAMRAGHYRYELARVGRTVSFPDSLIAATARELDAIVLTRNLKDFPMTDISVVAPGR